MGQTCPVYKRCPPRQDRATTPVLPVSPRTLTQAQPLHALLSQATKHTAARGTSLTAVTERGAGGSGGDTPCCSGWKQLPVVNKSQFHPKVETELGLPSLGHSLPLPNEKTEQRALWSHPAPGIL